MLSFALGFLVSLLITLLIVRYAHLHEKFSTDTDLAGVQKFHARPVPRIGGTGILLGLIVSAVQLHHAYPAVSGGILGLIALPIVRGRIDAVFAYREAAIRKGISRSQS